MSIRSLVLPAALVAALLSACVAALLATSHEAEAAFPGRNGQIGGEGKWSPDGTKVVFARLENESDPDSSEIYIKDMDSGETKQLTDDPNGCVEDPDFGTTCFHGNRDPAWSPDGSKVAFVASQESGDPCDNLTIINTDGSDRKIIDRCAFATTHLAWSPDGKQIAYKAWTGEWWEIWVIGANGTNNHRLYARPTGTVFADGIPEWSPDGKQVLFGADEQDNEGFEIDHALWKVNADGSDRIRLIETDRRAQFTHSPWYAWSPDGTKIAYDKGGEIWTMKPDGSAQINTNAPVNFDYFDWQPLCTVMGTSANDALSGTSSKDIICGMGGDDRLKGLAGSDVLLGGDGEDALLGGKGDDRIFGGLGTDTASYRSSATGVRASMIEEGASGEGTDAFMTLDNLQGSPFADELIGSPGANVLRGGKGPDILRGRGASDILMGDLGADQHYGENGDDTIDSRDGVTGNDSLSGGADTDTCLKDATEKSVIFCEQ